MRRTSKFLRSSAARTQKCRRDAGFLAEYSVDLASFPGRVVVKCDENDTADRFRRFAWRRQYKSVAEPEKRA